jgi:hypothetical protein
MLSDPIVDASLRRDVGELRFVGRDVGRLLAGGVALAGGVGTEVVGGDGGGVASTGCVACASPLAAPDGDW